MQFHILVSTSFAYTRNILTLYTWSTNAGYRAYGNCISISQHFQQPHSQSASVWSDAIVGGVKQICRLQWFLIQGPFGWSGLLAETRERVCTLITWYALRPTCLCCGWRRDYVRVWRHRLRSTKGRFCTATKQSRRREIRVFITTAEETAETRCSFEKLVKHSCKSSTPTIGVRRIGQRDNLGS